MKTRFSSTEPAAPTGFVNAQIGEVLEGGVRKIAVWVPDSGGVGRWWARAILSGYQPPAEDVLVNRYRMILDSEKVTIFKCGTTAKVGPVGSDFVADILRSGDDGATWESIFASGSPLDSDLAFIEAGQFRGDQFAFAIDTLYPDDLLRIDVLTNEDTVGVEIVLEGVVSPITSPISSPA